MPSNFRIDNPCPFSPTIMNKREEGYFCKSCNKTIIDFRGKTSEEIKNKVKKGTCGIFTRDQLPGQQQMKLSHKLFFYFLSFISVLGFAIKPVSAQPKKPMTDSISQNIKPNSKTKDGALKSETLKKRKSFFNRKEKHRLIGCPQF